LHPGGRCSVIKNRRLPIQLVTAILAILYTGARPGEIARNPDYGNNQCLLWGDIGLLVDREGKPQSTVKIDSVSHLLRKDNPNCDRDATTLVEPKAGMSLPLLLMALGWQDQAFGTDNVAWNGSGASRSDPTSPIDPVFIQPRLDPTPS